MDEEPGMTPQTLEEWKAYIATLSGPDLLSKAKAANSVAFVRALEEDGHGPFVVHEVLITFARRLAADGQEPPGRTTGSYLNYGIFLTPNPLESGLR